MIECFQTRCYFRSSEGEAFFSSAIREAEHFRVFSIPRQRDVRTFLDLCTVQMQISGWDVKEVWKSDPFYPLGLETNPTIGSS